MRHSPKSAINLAAAVHAAGVHQGTELTLAELARAYCAAILDESDLRLKKWVEAFGHQSAWA
ncbi:MAG: hypothetical protein ACJ8GO_05910, partial [Ramlibacter sp.]